MSFVNLENQVALVTGASGGIGKEIALSLAKSGAFVLVHYNGSKEKAEAVVSEIEAMGQKAKAVGFNVADYDACKESVDAILKEYQKVDILVNNAGITKDNLILRMTSEQFDSVIDTNLKGAFHMISLLSKNFIKLRKGKIINIASVSGVMGNAGQANYAASKAGMIGLTKSVARELASRGICVNAVAPGFIETPMTDVFSQEKKDEFAKAIPLGRLGKPEEVANLVTFLAGKESDYMTGQVICIDGGMAM